MTAITIHLKTKADLTVPYPYRIDTENGDVLDQDTWKGDPARLLGFQETRVQRVKLFFADWIKDPKSAVGLYPVFLESGGTMFSLTIPVAAVDVPDSRQLVWVATVTGDEMDYGRPAVYVAPTEDDLITVIRKQNGIPDSAELLEWLEEHHMVAVWDSHYVEKGNDDE